jgi:DNA polymerase III subunit epsilon
MKQNMPHQTGVESNDFPRESRLAFYALSSRSVFSKRYSSLDIIYPPNYNKIMNFRSIDFETATGYRNSACAIAIISIKNGEIIDRYYQLIQPPGNAYWSQNIAVHGIRPIDTAQAPTFAEVYPEIKMRLAGQTIVAHNEPFDRGVLRSTMEHYGLNYDDLALAARWECTVKIYRSKGFRPANLAACCQQLNIPLDHHNALSDALACAKLFQHHLTGEYE